MARKRRRFTAEFKGRVALEALRERDSVQAITARHELHRNQVSAWKRQLPDAVPEVFARDGGAYGRPTPDPKADRVSCADITLCPCDARLFYLVVVMDWATRHMLAWRLSNTMDATFCVGALDDSRDPEHGSGSPVHQRGLRRPGAGRRPPILDGRPGPLPRRHLHRTATTVPEVRGRVPARTLQRAGCGTDHRNVGRLLQRRPSALVGRVDAG